MLRYKCTNVHFDVDIYNSGDCGWKRRKYDHFRTTVSEGVSEVEVPETEYVTCGVCDGVPTEEYH